MADCSQELGASSLKGEESGQTCIEAQGGCGYRCSSTRAKEARALPRMTGGQFPSEPDMLMPKNVLADSFDIGAVEVDGDGLRDLLDGNDEPGSILFLHQNAFPSGKGAMLDAHPVSKF
jgi:hypothetical protein